MKDESRIRVLIVDGEEGFAMTLATRLQQRGMATECLASGDAAIAAVKKHPPRVVVLDMMVSGSTGIEVLRRLKTICPNLKVILLAGRGTFNTGLLCMQYGAWDYFPKPLELNQLVEAITAAAGDYSTVKGSSPSLPQ